MQLAKLGQHGLGTQLQPGRTAGVPPARRRTLGRLQRSHGRAQLLQQGYQIGLDREQVVLRSLVPAARRMRRQHRGDDQALVLRLVAAEHRSDLEHRHVREAPARVAAGGLDQTGQGRGPHGVDLGRHGVGQHQLSRPSAEQPGDGVAGEGPGQQLAVAGGGQGAPGCAGAALTDRQHAVGRPRRLRQRGGGQGVVAGDAGHFLDQIGLAFHITPPGRGRDGPGLAGCIDGEAQLLQDLTRGLRRDGQAGQLPHIGRIEAHRRRRGQGLARHHHVRRLAAAEPQDHPGRQLQPTDHEAGVDPAGEAVLGVGGDAGGATGLGRADRIEPGALKENLGGLVRTAGALAAHDPAHAHRPFAVGVGDDAHLRAQVVGLAVQGDQVLVAVDPMAAQARGDAGPDQHGGVIDVQRPGPVVGDQVGDIDQGVDRAQTDGLEPGLQPGGGGTVLHAPDQPAREDAAGLAVHRDSDRAGELAGDRRHGQIAQGPKTSRRQVAGDAGNAQPVGPVGGDLEVDHRFQTQGLGGGSSHRQAVVELQDAVGLLGGLHLGGRAEHAVGDHAAHRLLHQGYAQARHIAADRGVDGGQANAGVGRPADDLLAAVDRLDLADPQPVGVRVLHGLDDPGHGEGRQPGRGIEDMLDLQPRHGHGVNDLGGGRGCVEVLLQPGQREFHVGDFSARICSRKCSGPA